MPDRYAKSGTSSRQGFTSTEGEGYPSKHFPQLVDVTLSSNVQQIHTDTRGTCTFIYDTLPTRGCDLGDDKLSSTGFAGSTSGIRGVQIPASTCVFYAHGVYPLATGTTTTGTLNSLVHPSGIISMYQVSV